MSYQLSAQAKRLVDTFIQQSGNNSVILQQLALDASQILGCTEQRLIKQQNMGGLGRFWHTVSGKAKQDSLSNTTDLIQAQEYALCYLNVLQENQLMQASTMLAVKNNLNQLAMDSHETKVLMLEMAKNIGQRFIELEQRTEQLEVHRDIHSWLNIIEDEDYLWEMSPNLRFLTVVKQFYRQKEGGPWNISELKLFRTALRKVGLNHKESIQLGQFVADLVEELQAPGKVESYEDLLNLQTAQGQPIGWEYLRDNISMPSLLALKQLPNSFQRLQPAVEVLKSKLQDNTTQLNALQEVVHNDIVENYFIDLNQQMTLFELGVQLLSGFSLAVNLRQQQLEQQSYEEERLEREKELEFERKTKLEPWLREYGFSNIHDKDDQNWTPLHIAALCGETEVVQLLLSNGADVNHDIGSTPLHLAADNSHIEVAHLLLKNSANINAKDCDGRTPLDRAVLGGHTEMVDYLHYQGAVGKG